MSVERQFVFDKDTKLLHVSAVTKDTFSQDQLKNILNDLNARLKQADEMISKFSKIKDSLLNMSKQARLLEIVESVFSFLPDAKIPDLENVNRTLKYYKENREQLEKDISELKPYLLEV